MTEFLALAQQLAGVGFPTMLVIILWASYKGWWTWDGTLTKAAAIELNATHDKIVIDIKIDYERRLLKFETQNQRLETMLFRSVGVTEAAVGLVKKSDIV